MKKIALSIMIITIISKVFGFARDVTLSYFYGASYITDAYLISIIIPTAIFGFISSGIATGFIPMYTKIEKLDGSKEGNRYINNLINIMVVLCSVILVFGLVFTTPLVRIFASGFTGETLELTVKFTRVGLVAMYFTGFVSIFVGFLQIKNKYSITALIGLPLNIIIILSIIISAKGNIILLAVGTVIATASQLLLLLPFVFKSGYRYKPILNIKDKYIKDMIYISLPVIVGVSVNQINVLVDRTIASKIAEGGISALNYASQINGFVQGILVLPIITVLYPMISKMAAEKNMDSFKKSVSEAINIINLLVTPAIVGSMMFSKPIVIFLFGRGMFSEKDIAVTSVALFFYSLGLLGFGLRDVLARAFYALQDTKTPTINAAIAVVLNIILNVILSKFMGIGGLALATSISAIFTTTLLFISLRKKVGTFGIRYSITSFVKILCSSLIMGLVAIFTYNGVGTHVSQNLALIAAIVIGALVYSVIIYFMKIEEVDVLVGAVKKKIGKV